MECEAAEEEWAGPAAAGRGTCTARPMVCASRITRRISGFLKRTKKDSIDQCHYPRDGGLWVNRGGGVGARGEGNNNLLPELFCYEGVSSYEFVFSPDSIPTRLCHGADSFAGA